MLISHFGWRSIFLAAVPVGIAVLALAIPSIPETADPQARHFDGTSQVLGAVALGGFIFAAIESSRSTTMAATGLVAAIITLALFIRTEGSKGSAALVPLDIFRSRTFCGAATATAGMTFGMYGVLFLLPLTWLSSGKLDAIAAGQRKRTVGAAAVERGTTSLSLR